MPNNALGDENVAWPSYVDFLASFSFVLILFVTWSVSLLAGIEKEETIQEGLRGTAAGFIKEGFEAVVEGHKLRIPLTDKVVFELSRHTLNEAAKMHLREAGRLIAAHPSVKRIVVMGYADNVKPLRDEFFNWEVSVARAQEVLRFLYLCKDCGYPVSSLRPKLVLHGAGDLDSRKLLTGELRSGATSDRRVDIVLEWGDDGRL